MAKRIGVWLTPEDWYHVEAGVARLAADCAGKALPDDYVQELYSLHKNIAEQVEKKVKS